VHDLGIDSLDLLDIGFAVDEAFGITMPLGQWLHEVHLKTIRAERHFIMYELCAQVDSLVWANRLTGIDRCG
jgi:hypothetical protein